VDEKPIQLEYASAGSPAKPMRGSVVVATVVVVVGLLAWLMPPVVGSGRLSPNVFWGPTWWVTFALVDAYVWLRLRESKPRSLIGALLTGTGSTTVLAALALMLVEEKPSFRLLVSVCAMSVVVAGVGCWITRRSGIAGGRLDAGP